MSFPKQKFVLGGQGGKGYSIPLCESTRNRHSDTTNLISPSFIHSSLTNLKPTQFFQFVPPMAQQIPIQQLQLQAFMQKQLISNSNQRKNKTVIYGNIDEKKMYDPEITFCGEKMPLCKAIAKVIEEKDPAPMADRSLECPSKICPIGHVPITIPCRGNNCQHKECFDMKQYFLLIGEKTFHCPFCQAEITQDDIRFDPFFFTYEIRNAVQFESIGFNGIQQNDLFNDMIPMKQDINDISWI